MGHAALWHPFFALRIGAKFVRVAETIVYFLSFRARLRPIVAGAGPDEVIRLILFDNMADPTSNAAQGEDEKGRTRRQTQYTTGCDQAKIYIWLLSNLGKDGITRGANNTGGGGIGCSGKGTFN